MHWFWRAAIAVVHGLLRWHEQTGENHGEMRRHCLDRVVRSGRLLVEV